MGRNFAKEEDDEGIVWRLRAGLTRIREVQVLPF